MILMINEQNTLVAFQGLDAYQGVWCIELDSFFPYSQKQTGEKGFAM